MSKATDSVSIVCLEQIGVYKVGDRAVVSQWELANGASSKERALASIERLICENNLKPSDINGIFGKLAAIADSPC